jgi:hypothetical protein
VLPRAADTENVLDLPGLNPLGPLGTVLFEQSLGMQLSHFYLGMPLPSFSHAPLDMFPNPVVLA